VPEIISLHKLHLLIVEDVIEDAELIHLALESAGIDCTCQVADRIQDCKSLLQGQSWDAVLADFRLFEATAYQVLGIMQELKIEIPLILVTGALGEEAAVECIKAGITDYVLKDRLFRLPMVLARSLREFELHRQQQKHLHQIQQQAIRETLINHIGQALNSSLDPDFILQEIVRLTGECFSVDRVIIFANHSEFVQITHEWCADDRVPSLLNAQTPWSEWLGEFDPKTQNLILKPLHLPNCDSLQRPPSQEKILWQKPLCSLLRAPIFIRESLFGAIELHTTTCERIFTNEEIYLFEKIADQAAIALYNAQSYERLETLVKERTQELEAEKLLSDAANRAKSEFLANMSHELRTPLTSILGFSSVLLKQVFGPLSGKQTQYLNNIHTSGEHLLALINDLLDLSKIEAGYETLFIETTDIQEVCESCLSFVQEQAEMKNLSLTFEMHPSITTCLADKRRLRQILVNLLSNAVKFTETGSILLTVQHSSDRQLLFMIKDTGIGIAPSDLGKLFQPFHQIETGLDKKYEGTGLGLALAQKLAQLHQGNITVTSKLGDGSCFTLHLPQKND
jgi:signal transduction histidine kinase/response regulator of citrate/malate metabolism